MFTLRTEQIHVFTLQQLLHTLNKYISETIFLHRGNPELSINNHNIVIVYLVLETEGVFSFLASQRSILVLGTNGVSFFVATFDYFIE